MSPEDKRWILRLVWFAVMTIVAALDGDGMYVSTRRNQWEYGEDR